MNNNSAFAGLARALQSLPMLPPDWQIDDLLARLDEIEALPRCEPASAKLFLVPQPVRERRGRRTWRARSRPAAFRRTRRQAAAAGIS